MSALCSGSTAAGNPCRNPAADGGTCGCQGPAAPGPAQPDLLPAAAAADAVAASDPLDHAPSHDLTTAAGLTAALNTHHTAHGNEGNPWADIIHHAPLDLVDLDRLGDSDDEVVPLTDGRQVRLDEATGQWVLEGVSNHDLERLAVLEAEFHRPGSTARDIADEINTLRNRIAAATPPSNTSQIAAALFDEHAQAAAHARAVADRLAQAVLDDLVAEVSAILPAATSLRLGADRDIKPNRRGRCPLTFLAAYDGDHVIVDASDDGADDIHDTLSSTGARRLSLIHEDFDTDDDLLVHIENGRAARWDWTSVA